MRLVGFVQRLERETFRVSRLAEFASKALNLPSTPLKPTEKRRDRWRAATGQEQTESDALLALHPGELRRIAYDAIKPFFDFGLAERCQAALAGSVAEIRERFEQHPARLAGERKIRAAFENLEEAKATLARARSEATAALGSGGAGIRGTSIPPPELKIETKPPPPLVTTADDFVAASRKLIADKALEDLDEDDEP